jgi:2-keto-3-deoxy-L-rhamnonate aldolase RhmA
MIWEFATRGIAKIVEAADLDFVFLDMEHTALDPAGVADLTAWFKATSIAPIVRVPQSQYHFIARSLDAGALGVMCANVETAEQAREIVQAAKYAPLGNRGVGIGGAHNDYYSVDAVQYFHDANENTSVICQIESVRGLENCEEIAAVPGVDVLWVGHMDLSTSMGIVGQFDQPAFHAALDRVVAAAQKYGKFTGIQPSTPEQARDWIGHGFQAISWSTDVGVYRAGLIRAIEDLRKI